MKSISLLASLTALSALCVAFGCSDKSDGNNGTAGSTSVAGRTSTGGGDAEAGDTGENGGKTSSGGRTSSGGASSNAGEAGDNSAVAGDTSAGGDKGSADGTITSCGEGVVIEGDPLYDDDAMPATDGQGVFADPPVRNQAIAVIGNDFYVETDQEIWRVDLSVAAAKRKLTRVAGVELDSGGFVNAGVACADTTFLSIRDMAATADGKLVVVDYVANSVIEITNPGTATCKSAWVAGTHVKSPDPGANFPVTYGDVDGPGASALFGGGKGAGIQKVAVDPDGNIYTFDNGTGKFKQIATDADRTVSTIGQGLADDTINGLTFLNGKLYAVGVDGTNDLLLEIDPAKYKVATPKANVKRSTACAITSTMSRPGIKRSPRKWSTTARR
jgi:hypothetical protein